MNRAQRHLSLATRIFWALAAERHFCAPARTERESTQSMTDFRFYCLNDKNSIIRSGDLDVLDLDSAVRDAYRDCGDHPRLPSSRIEIWQGVSRLYASKVRLPQGFFAKLGLIGRGRTERT